MTDSKKPKQKEEFGIEFGDVNGIKLYEILNKPTNEASNNVNSKKQAPIRKKKE